MKMNFANSSNTLESAPGIIEMDQLPGPKGVPVLGNLLELNPKKLHRILENWSNEYGSIFKIKFATRHVVVITKPETYHHVLRSRPEKFRRLEKMDNIIRELSVLGVFNAEGEEWKRQRKLFSQALDIRRLKAFFPDLVRITEKLLNRLNELSAENSPIEIKSQLMRYTVDITSRLAFGYNMNTIEQKDDVIQDHLKIFFPAIFKRINSPFAYWRYFKLPADKKVDRSIEVIQKTMQQVIDKTREEMVENADMRNNPSNFLQALLAASDSGKPVSNKEIIGNVLTMLIAGEDTTAHSLAWIIYFMLLYPEVQQKMQQEADEILAHESTLKNYDDLEKLTYIEAVAFEAMRLKPVAPLLFLNTLEDVVIEGVRIPKSTGVIVQTHHAATKEEHFSSPEKFIPERWISGVCPAAYKHNEWAFAPFGAGPRFCPGYNLALLEIKAVLSMICKNFKVIMETKPEDVDEVLAFTMMPSDFFIRLEKRSN